MSLLGALIQQLQLDCWSLRPQYCATKVNTNFAMSKRILLVSYEGSLLATRRLLLEQRGHTVTAALGFTEAFAHCKTNAFDLFILGHSIPISDKRGLIRTFRQYCPAPVLSLDRQGEGSVGSDFHVSADDPEQFLKTVEEVLSVRARSITP